MDDYLTTKVTSMMMSLLKDCQAHCGGLPAAGNRLQNTQNEDWVDLLNKLTALKTERLIVDNSIPGVEYSVEVRRCTTQDELFCGAHGRPRKCSQSNGAGWFIAEFKVQSNGFWAMIKISCC